MTAQPEDAMLADEEDRLPLHLALWHCASLNVVSLLLDAFPESAEDEGGGALLRRCPRMSPF